MIRKKATSNALITLMRRDAQILKAGGFDDNNIAYIIGVERNRLSDYLNNLKKTKSKKVATEETFIKIRDMRRQGYSSADICKVIGVSAPRLERLRQNARDYWVEKGIYEKARDRRMRLFRNEEEETKMKYPPEKVNRGKMSYQDYLKASKIKMYV